MRGPFPGMLERMFLIQNIRGEKLKKLVVFYSYEGNTRLVAENIADAVGADLLEIKPEKEMTSKGFMKFVWGGRQVMMGKRPDLLPLERDPGDYDLIFVGTPVWAWSPSPPIRTFLEKHMPGGKKVVLFSCNEGGNGKTFVKMRKMIPHCEILGEHEFFAPLRKNRESTVKIAVDWARSIAEPSDR